MLFCCPKVSRHGLTTLEAVTETSGSQSLAGLISKCTSTEQSRIDHLWLNGHDQLHLEFFLCPSFTLNRGDRTAGTKVPPFFSSNLGGRRHLRFEVVNPRCLFYSLDGAELVEGKDLSQSFSPI